MKLFLSIAILLLQMNLLAQESLPLTDASPVTVNGLQAGYSITSEKEKEVGNKGDFSRFQVEFYVTNISSEAKILLHRQGFVIGGNGVSPNIAQFKCSNATGARMTSKEWTLQAKPCTVEALIDDTDPSSNKPIQRKKMANIGYWIKPGETISIKNVVIVPLNERPNIAVIFFPGPVNTVGAVINSNDTYNTNQYTGNNNQNNQSPVNNNLNFGQGFLRIKNIDNKNYLHNQNGPLACTGIDMGWWSAQWQILPANGSRYFLIRNRWKNNYLSIENDNMLSDNSQSPGAQWSIEESGNNTYIIKNAANNAKLVFENGELKTAAQPGKQPSAQWIIEK